jgi:hypothetical protein
MRCTLVAHHLIHPLIGLLMLMHTGRMDTRRLRGERYLLIA